MRLWIALAILGALSSASAEMVIREPPVIRACSRSASWAAAEACMSKLGRSKIVRGIAGAQLVKVELKAGDGARPEDWYDAGLYLFVERGKQWVIAGMFEASGSDYAVLDFQPLTVNKHRGHRIDLGQTIQLTVQPDGVTNVPALMVKRSSMFCGGDSYYCTDVVTSCDVLVDGKAMWTFRGELAIEGNELKIAGDRRYAGPWCTSAPNAFLGWTSG